MSSQYGAGAPGPRDRNRLGGGPTDTGTRPMRGGRSVPVRVMLLGALVVLILIATSTSSIRNHWASALRSLTGGNRTADYIVGLVVGLLPVIGVLLGAIRTRGGRRVVRMVLFGGIGFIATYLLAPSPSRYLTDHAVGHVFATKVPGYLAGVFTGVGIWVVLGIVAVLRARARWRRFTRRHTGGPPSPGGRSPGGRPPGEQSPGSGRVIDV